MRSAPISAAALLLGLAGCGFTYTTIPEPFVRPGARIFYLKTVRQTETEVSSYKGTGISTTVQYTRYTAVDLASCRKLGVVTVPGKTWEMAWDSDGGDNLWFTQNLDFKDGRSFRGRQAEFPRTSSGGDWAKASTLRLVASPGEAPAIWDFHTGRKTPVPEDAIQLAQRRWTSNGARQLLALAPNATDGGVDVLVVDQASGDGPPSFRRETLAVEGIGPQRVGLSSDDSAIVFADAKGLVEAFDLEGGRKLWTTPTPEYAIIGGGRSPVFAFKEAPAVLANGFPCTPGVDLMALVAGALPRKVAYPGCLQGLEWVEGGRFLIGSVGEERHDAINAAFDTESGRMVSLPRNAAHPVSVGGALLFDDGDRDGPSRRRQLFKVDFQHGASPVDRHAADIRFVVPDPVSGTVVVSAASDDVRVYRASTGRLERCIEP